MKAPDLFEHRERCPACEGVDMSLLVSVPYEDEALAPKLIERHGGRLTRTDLAGAAYEVAACNACGLLFQTYVPTPELAHKIYTRNKAQADKSFEKTQRVSFDQYLRTARLVEKIAALLDASRPSSYSVLDFGAGWGRFLDMARAHGFAVAGVELSVERREYLAKQGLSVVESLDALPAGASDAIYSDQVFEHLSDPLPALRALSARLKPGGIAYLAVPDGNGAHAHFARFPRDFFFKKLYPLEHLNSYSTRALTALGERAGLTRMTPVQVARRLARHAGFRHNVEFWLEAAKALYAQRYSTSLYFTKAVSQTAS